MSPAANPDGGLNGPDATIAGRGGIRIPRLGLGVFRVAKGRPTRGAVAAALRAGYRHIDTATVYDNERDVGIAIRDSAQDRREVFVTTKVWNTDQGFRRTLDAFDRSRRRLGGVVDLFLVHWPVPELRLDTWRAMEQLFQDGRVRAIGVSNYMHHHLLELLEVAEIPPAVNQIELHPYNYRSRGDVIALCEEAGIVVEAYSPLTQGRMLEDSALTAMAARYGKDAAQILIRWALQKDLVVLPKSTDSARIASNADVFDFHLSDDDMATLDAFDKNLITSWDPTNVP
jgi:diketogulonate reductase-like aldo/keto reductase